MGGRSWSWVIVVTSLMCLKFVIFITNIDLQTNLPSYCMYLLLLSLMITSYFRTIVSSPGYYQYLQQQSEEEEDQEQGQSESRYCDFCGVNKPPYIHHCRQCRQCIVEMDHHCPWVNNCIGMFNKKLFILFVFYASTCCLYMSWVCWTQFSTFQSPSNQLRLWNLMTWYLAIGIGTVLFFYFWFNLYLIATDRTTLKFLKPSNMTRAVQVNRQTMYQKFTFYFGRNAWMWAIPVQPQLALSQLSTEDCDVLRV